MLRHGCESWTVKKTEHWRIDTFKLWCWRRLLRESLGLQGDQSSILKEISPEYSLEGMMLTLKLQYFGHMMQKNWLTGKDPDAGKEWRKEEKGTTEEEKVGWYHQLDGHEFEQVLGVGDRQGILACSSPWGGKESDMTAQLNWLTDVLSLDFCLKISSKISMWKSKILSSQIN